MTSPLNKPQWQLPVGVSRGTWDYLQAKHIAHEYDAYFADSALMQLDMAFVRDRLPPLVTAASAPLVADLGCGTGRVARQLLPLGYRMLNIDLSPSMLEAARANLAREHQANCEFLAANLVELDRVVPPESVEFAVCLFSSIGMIRKRANRQRFLRGVRQMLREDGQFILHVHNRYCSWFDPGGPRWLLNSWWNSIRHQDAEFGDRVYAYRGLPKMFLHIYSHRELVQDLANAGFSSVQIVPISLAGDRLLLCGNQPAAFSWLRAGGFFAVCGK